MEAPRLVALLLLPALILLSVMVSVSDWRQRRIPNTYLLTGWIYVIAVHAALGTQYGGLVFLKGVGYSLLGLLLATVILYPGYHLKQLGAGDVKLAMVIGWFLGPIGAALSILTGALIGGLWALILSWRLGGLQKTLSNIASMARSAYLSGFREMNWDLRSAGAITMPYGVALSGGAILIAAWQLSL